MSIAVFVTLALGVFTSNVFERSAGFEAGQKATRLQAEFRVAQRDRSAPNPPGNLTLDRFLGGLLPECRVTGDFDRYVGSMVARYGRDVNNKINNARAAIVAPPSIVSVLGEPRAKNLDEHVEVVVPLKGTFRSLEVSALEFAFGKQNGINIKSVIFAEPLTRVRATLGRDVAQGKRRFKAIEASGEAAAAIDISVVDGKVKLICDLST